MKRVTEEPAEVVVQVKKTKGAIPKFDVATDSCCVGVRGFFEESRDKKTPVQISRDAVWTDSEGTKFLCGQLLYSLRTKYRDDKEHTLVKSRFDALSHIPQFVEFMNAPVVPKGKKSPSATYVVNGLQQCLTQHENCFLYLCVMEAKERMRHAQLDLNIAKVKKQRMLQSSKKAKPDVFVDTAFVIRKLESAFLQQSEQQAPPPSASTKTKTK